MSAADSVERFLGWEEGLFGYAYKRFRALTGRGQPTGPDPTRAAFLQPLSARLTVLAQLVAETPMRVRESEGLGGVRGPVLLLPRAIAVAETPEANADLYLARTFITAEMARQGYDAPPGLAGDSLEAQVVYALAAKAAQDALVGTMPGFAERLSAVCELTQRSLRERALLEKLAAGERAWLTWLLAISAPGAEAVGADEALSALRQAGAGRLATFAQSLLWGGPLSQADEAIASEAAAAMAEGAENPDGTEHQAPSRDEVRRILLEKTEEVEPMPVHSFEKAECLDSYRGGKRKVDGDDELDDHLEEALSGRSARCSAAEKTPWRAAGRYRPGWRRARRRARDARREGRPLRRVGPEEEALPAGLGHGLRPLGRRSQAGASRSPRRRHLRLIGRIARERTRLSRVKRQLDAGGGHPRLAAGPAIEEKGLRAAGHSAPGRVYEKSHRRQRDTACTVLLDVSLSSGSWIDNRCVLDLTRAAVVVLGEVTAALGDPLQVWASAATRGTVPRLELKGFRRPGPPRVWAPSSRAATRGWAPRSATRSLSS
ncbi:MAG: hypothetical protein R3F39_16100 [Myxococcota bacterium]